MLKKKVWWKIIDKNPTLNELKDSRKKLQITVEIAKIEKKMHGESEKAKASSLK